MHKANIGLRKAEVGVGLGNKKLNNEPYSSAEELGLFFCRQIKKDIEGNKPAMPSP